MIKRITKESYDKLISEGLLAWGEDDAYYSDLSLIEDEFKPLVTEAKKYLIYQFVGANLFDLTPYDHPGNITFPDQLDKNLYKDYKLYYGEKVQSIFYSEFDLDTKTLSKPVVKVDYVYTRNADYLLEYKTRTVSWAYEDGTWSDQVQVDVIPYLSEAKKLHEIKMVRNNVIEEAESLAKQLGLFDFVQQLFEKYLSDITLYREAGSRNFANDIATDLEHSFWLDEDTPDGKMTVREFLMGFFMIGTKESSGIVDPDLA